MLHMDLAAEREITEERAPDVPAAEVQLPPPAVFPGLALSGDRGRGAEATQGGAELVVGGVQRC